MKNVITIGREHGSGGRMIGRQLAEELGIPFYNKELIEMAAKESGLSEEFIRQAEQQHTGSFLYNLYFSSQNLPLADQVFITESKVIQRIAAEGPCVIVGRCSNYVLRERGDCLHVFIHAPLEQRLWRVQEDYKANLDEAAVRRRDKARAAYYNHFTPWRWGDYHNYDCTLNSGLGIDTVVSLLKTLVRKEGANL